LQRIAFPPGGIGAGSISLGGQGQLCDLAILYRPDKGIVSGYAFTSICGRAENREPIARVLEARFTPPYDGAAGLGLASAPDRAGLIQEVELANDTDFYAEAYPFIEKEKLITLCNSDVHAPIMPQPDTRHHALILIQRGRGRNT
jgi:hypothetical protein